MTSPKPDSNSTPDPAGNAGPDRDDTPADGDSDASGGSLLDTFVYGLSLPERATRSLSAVVGGMVGQTANRLIPLAFRSSRSYEVFIQQSLDVLVHDVGGVQRDVDEETTALESSLAQKAVGGLLDVAAGATMHLSPLTVLAVFNDLAYGSNEYLKVLAKEWREEGIIDDDSTIDHVTDLIDAAARASRKASDSLEAPPMDLAGLRQTVDQMRSEINRVDPTSLLPRSEVTRLWGEIEDIAAQSELGIVQVGTTMTMHAIAKVDLVTRGTLSSIRVAGNLFDQHIIDHYQDAIVAIHHDGLYETIRRDSEPYVSAVWDNFSGQRETWTGDLLSGKLLGQAWGGLRSWWSSESDAKPGAETPPKTDGGA
ncbi:MAG: hypothetical protein AAF958_14485 [Planctomycetota bacterium]